MANIQTIKENQYIKLNKDFYEIKNMLKNIKNKCK